MDNKEKKVIFDKLPYETPADIKKQIYNKVNQFLVMSQKYKKRTALLSFVIAIIFGIFYYLTGNSYFLALSSVILIYYMYVKAIAYIYKAHQDATAIHNILLAALTPDINEYAIDDDSNLLLSNKTYYKDIETIVSKMYDTFLYNKHTTLTPTIIFDVPTTLHVVTAKNSDEPQLVSKWQSGYVTWVHDIGLKELNTIISRGISIAEYPEIEDNVIRIFLPIFFWYYDFPNEDKFINLLTYKRREKTQNKKDNSKNTEQLVKQISKEYVPYNYFSHFFEQSDTLLTFLANKQENTNEKSNEQNSNQTNNNKFNITYLQHMLNVINNMPVHFITYIVNASKKYEMFLEYQKQGRKEKYESMEHVIIAANDNMLENTIDTIVEPQVKKLYTISEELAINTANYVHRFIGGFENHDINNYVFYLFVVYILVPLSIIGIVYGTTYSTVPQLTYITILFSIGYYLHLLSLFSANEVFQRIVDDLYHFEYYTIANRVSFYRNLNTVSPPSHKSEKEIRKEKPEYRVKRRFEQYKLLLSSIYHAIFANVIDLNVSPNAVTELAYYLFMVMPFIAVNFVIIHTEFHVISIWYVVFGAMLLFIFEILMLNVINPTMYKHLHYSIIYNLLKKHIFTISGKEREFATAVDVFTILSDVPMSIVNSIDTMIDKSWNKVSINISSLFKGNILKQLPHDSAEYRITRHLADYSYYPLLDEKYIQRIIQKREQLIQQCMSYPQLYHIKEALIKLNQQKIEDFNILENQMYYEHAIMWLKWLIVFSNGKNIKAFAKYILTDITDDTYDIYLKLLGNPFFVKALMLSTMNGFEQVFNAVYCAYMN